MPIKLRLGQLHTNGEDKVFEGLKDVIANIRLDAFVSVKLLAGPYVCGMVAPFHRSDFEKLGLKEIHGHPIALVTKEDRPNYARSCLERTYRIVPWSEVKSVYQGSGGNFENLFEYFTR